MTAFLNSLALVGLIVFWAIVVRHFLTLIRAESAESGH